MIWNDRIYSLGEVGESIEFEFTARNLTDADVTYDQTALTVITDDADEDGMVSDMRKLTVNAAMPSEVTVPANGEAKIKVSFSLDDEETKEIMEVFRNGFFVDGFVSLSTTDKTDDVPEIGIPFTGFYGGWESAPALDDTYYSGNSILEESYLYDITSRLPNGSYGAKKNMIIMGTNRFADDEDYASEDYVGYSPNDDGEADIPMLVLTPLRRLGRSEFAICDGDGNELLSKTDMSDGEEYHCEKFNQTYVYFAPAEINALSEGDYTMKYTAGFIGQKDYKQNESAEFKFYLDRKKPVITKFEKSADGRTLTAAATDNRHLMGFVVSGTKNNEPYCASYPIKAEKEYETVINIEGIDSGSLQLEAVDYAQNSTKISETGLDIEYRGTAGASHLFVVKNNTGAAIDAAITMAMYKDGALVGINSKTETIPEGSSIETFNMDNVSYDAIKIFVWDSLENMMPIYTGENSYSS